MSFAWYSRFPLTICEKTPAVLVKLRTELFYLQQPSQLTWIYRHHLNNFQQFQLIEDLLVLVLAARAQGTDYGNRVF